MTVKNYASGIVPSNYEYPKEYKIKDIGDQIKIISELFELDQTHAMEFIKTLPTLPLGAEGWFAIPKVSAVAKKHFPFIVGSENKYYHAVEMISYKLSKTRNFIDYRTGEIGASKLRQHSRTLSFIDQIEKEQQGDIIIIAAQYGLLHQGESINQARETFKENEFGLSSFAVLCMTLVHPNRYTEDEGLDTDCPGDEFDDLSDGSFTGGLFFCFYRNRLRLYVNSIFGADAYYGSASGFV